jgi:iron-sulfur cluster assembly accessory protein
MISITEPASRHLKTLVEGSVEPGKGLRVYVEKGGCAGMQYGMTLDFIQEGDEVLQQDGVQVMVDAESLAYLNGSTIDYCDDLAGTGFRIKNPNAVRSCGCGTSFESAGTGSEADANHH